MSPEEAERCASCGHPRLEHHPDGTTMNDEYDHSTYEIVPGQGPGQDG